MYNMFALLKLLLSTLFLSHIFSCLWVYLANYQQKKGVSTWMDQFGYEQKPWYIQYLASYYYVCVTMNTVGYGDIVPKNPLETVYSIFFIYFACGMFAYTINSIGVIVQDIRKEDSIYKKELHIINAYMKKRSINFDLRMRVHKYFEYFWTEEKTCDKEEELTIINKLSNSLKDELLFEANKNILKKLPMFYRNFSPEALKRLINCMREVRFTPNDIIFNSGDHNDKSLYIIKKGEVEFFIEDFHLSKFSTVTVNKLKKDQVFGEISFFSNKERQISAKSLNFCTCVVIRQEDFLKVLENFPDDYEIYCKIKDKINLYNNYEELYIQCFCCKESNHLITDCPYVHYQPFREIIFAKYNFSNPQVRKKYKRWPKKDLNVLRHYFFIKKKTIDYISQKIRIELEISSESLESSDDDENKSETSQKEITNSKILNNKIIKNKEEIIRRLSEINKTSLEDIVNKNEDLPEKKRAAYRKNTLTQSYNDETLEDIKLLQNQYNYNEFLLDFDRFKLFNYYFTDGNYDFVIQKYNEYLKSKFIKKHKKQSYLFDDSKKDSIETINNNNSNKIKNTLKPKQNSYDSEDKNQAFWVNLTNAFIKENEKKSQIALEKIDSRKKILIKTKTLKKK